MGTTITPLDAPGKPVIRSYGDGRFRIADHVHEGSILVLPDAVRPWPVAEVAEITADNLSPVAGSGADLLIVGCGERWSPPPPDLGPALKAQGIAMEWMDTGAACRTFNLLLAEDRPVAAALIAVT